MYYYWARWYDPDLGRFIQPDQIIPDFYKAQAFDRYAYVLNNPIKYIDPIGLEACLEVDEDGKCITVEYALELINKDEMGEAPDGLEPIKDVSDPAWRGWMVTALLNGKLTREEAQEYANEVQGYCALLAE